MGYKVVVGLSNKHLHVSQEDLETLYGKDYVLTNIKDLKQLGQYACDEKVDVVGPKGTLKGLRILGPVRPESQIELALTDARAIGLAAPIRESGKLDGSPGCKLIGPKGEVTLSKGVIAALRHIHLSPQQAADAGLTDRQVVSVKLDGPRGLTFDEVLVRIHETYRNEFHLDTDEGNAGMLANEQEGEVIV